MTSSWKRLGNRNWSVVSVVNIYMFKVHLKLDATQVHKTEIEHQEHHICAHGTHTGNNATVFRQQQQDRHMYTRETIPQ